jgi:Protein of unknown function DUF262
MAYQTPITIKKALDGIHAREYVLPAIQREFVWKPDQICQLFDSLLRRYPIGAFLFWKVTAEHSRDFVFYEVMERYHERTHRHCDRLNLPRERAVTAILDGQQRLTALNIGLNGSHAEKLPRKWASSPDAYPVKELYLDLCHVAPDDELGMHYRFEFLIPERAREDSGETTHWYRVRDILGLAEGAMPAFDYIDGTAIAQEQRRAALEKLDRLRRTIHEDPVISYHEEEEQEIDRVLNIFIRVNSAGTELSYSDLLLSIATAQWTERDARETVNDLVDSLNGNGQGFGFSKDLVLKAGLVMTDAGDVRFKVANFNRPNMAKLEGEWDRIASALSIGARLLGSFGFSERTLTAHSVLTPIADYLFRRGVDESYLTTGQHADDRERIRDWVIRSLLKAGVWGSGLDTLLVAIRRVIREHPGAAFPLDEIQSAMARGGKSLRFEHEEIEDLVETQYGKGRAFVLLALLYPGIDVRNEFHVDHVFPRSRFTAKRLEQAGIAADHIAAFLDRVDRLPNLQLLEGSINVSKQDTLPLEWAESHHPDPQQRGLYFAGHDLDGLPADLADFLEFVDRRKGLMVDKLSSLLGVDKDAPLAAATSDQPAAE